MNRIQSLNGWRRLWVVVAAIGFLYTFWQSLEATSKYYQPEYNVWSAFDKPACKYIVDIPAGSKLDQKLTYNDPCWPLHTYRSLYANAANTKNGYFEHIGSLHRMAILEHFGVFLLVYYLPGIGLLYGTGLVVAWVLKGFRPRGT